MPTEEEMQEWLDSEKRICKQVIKELKELRHSAFMDGLVNATVETEHPVIKAFIPVLGYLKPEEEFDPFFQVQMRTYYHRNLPNIRIVTVVENYLLRAGLVLILKGAGSKKFSEELDSIVKNNWDFVENYERKRQEHLMKAHENAQKIPS